MSHNQSTIDLIKSTRALYNSINTNYREKKIIGWEHQLTNYELREDIQRLSSSECEKLLIKDLKKIDKGLKKLLPNHNLNQNQYNALVSLIYDIGLHNFKLSGIVELIKQEKYIEASYLFRKWNTYLKNHIYGLTKLRKIEIKLFTNM